MTKEEYIRDRERRAVDFDAAWEMYLNTDRERPRVGIDQFTLLFTSWIKNRKPYIDGYFEYYDRHFGINEEGE